MSGAGRRRRRDRAAPGRLQPDGRGAARARAAARPLRPPRRRGGGSPGHRAGRRRSAASSATSASCSSTSSAPPRWPNADRPTDVVELLNEFFGTVVEHRPARADGSTSSRATARCACSGRPPTSPTTPHGRSRARPGSRGGSAATCRPRRRRRRLLGRGGGRQRRHRAALRVHGHRRPRERGGPADRPGQAPRRAGAGLRRRARAAGERERRAWEFTGSEVLRGRGQATEIARPGALARG